MFLFTVNKENLPNSEAKKYDTYKSKTETNEEKLTSERRFPCPVLTIEV